MTMANSDLKLAQVRARVIYKFAGKKTQQAFFQRMTDCEGFILANLHRKPGVCFFTCLYFDTSTGTANGWQEREAWSFTDPKYTRGEIY